MGSIGWLARLVSVPLTGLAGLLATSAPAQNQGLVVRDGTLGSLPGGIVEPGPDDLGQANYLIRADLGEQRGGNLFHSFSRFSIGSGERVGSFAVRGPGGIPAESDGWLPAPMLPDTGAPTVVTAVPPVLVAGIPGPLLASGACP